jgi:hypothetical protein
MIELIATLVITVSSVVLFAYWFRYTSLLILSAKTARDYAGEVAMANQLSFVQVQSQLRETSNADLDRLLSLLDRDYAVLCRLLEQGSLENRMLAINYRVTHAWYGMSRKFSASAACRALDEMSQTVAFLANALGEQAHAGAAA